MVDDGSRLSQLSANHADADFSCQSHSVSRLGILHSITHMALLGMPYPPMPLAFFLTT